MAVPDLENDNDVGSVIEPPTSHHNIGNPRPLGLFSFACTTLIVSLYNLHARHVHTPNLIVAVGLFTGGFAQVLGGMWAFPYRDTFAGTAFTLYGSFWISYAFILLPGTGIQEAYQNNPSELAAALGIYLIVWTMVTVIFLIGSLKKNVAFIALFISLILAYMSLAIGATMSDSRFTKAGGGFGLVSALLAFYIGAAELFKHDFPFNIPLGEIPHFHIYWRHAPR